MTRVITTPAGRQKYLSILLKNLLKCRSEFDRWDIWLNTNVDSDIKYIHDISKEYEFINIVYSTVEYNGSRSIFNFFKHTTKQDEVYIRLDDDVVYIERDSLNKLFNARISDTTSFLLFGNIINNSLMTYLQQRLGVLSTEYGQASYNCTCDVGWNSPVFAECVHRDFLNNRENKSFYIPNWLLLDYERVSINVIAWRGDEFNKFDGEVFWDEEVWLTCIKPREIGAVNKIIGNTLFAHYSFFTQRDHMSSTDILKLYENISHL